MASDLAGSHSGEVSHRDPPPVEFVFDARNKSIVGPVFKLEAKRLKRFFSRKPKVSLHQIEEILKQKANGEVIKKSVDGFVSSYSASAEAHQFYESCGRLLLEAASKETDDSRHQWFLLNLALETTYLALQKSPKALNVPAQSVIVSIYRLLGKEGQESYYVEKEVHKEMLTVLTIKKDPNDFASREKLIKLYLKGRRYYEALIHTAEYEKTMQAKSRSLYRQKAGEIAMRKAGIFQMLVDFFQKIRTGNTEEGVNRQNELAKLNNFITRFNRDNKRINIVPLKGMDTLSLSKTLNSLVTIANTFYTDASLAEHYPLRHKAYFFIARNSFQFDNVKAALKTLQEGARYVETSRMQPKQRISEKLKFLEFEHRIYQELGQQRKVEELTQEMAKLRRDMRGQEGKGDSSEAAPQ